MKNRNRWLSQRFLLVILIVAGNSCQRKCDKIELLEKNISVNDRDVYVNNAIVSDHYRLSDPEFFFVDGPRIMTSKREFIPVEGKSLYMKSRGQSKDIKMLNQFINIRCKYFKMSVKDVLNLIKKTQIFSKPSCNLDPYKSGNCELMYDCDLNYALEIALNFKKSEENNLLRIDSAACNQFLVNESQSGGKNDMHSILESLQRYRYQNSHYFSLLDSISKIGTSSKYHYFIPLQQVPPIPIFRFKIDSLPDKFIVTKDVLNPEVFFDNEICL